MLARENSVIDNLVPVAGLSSGIAAVSAGNGHTCALTTAGGVLCWGANYGGQLGNDSTNASDVPVAVSGLSSGVAAVSAGDSHACALTLGGAVLCWGLNWSGQLGNDSTTASSVPVAVPGLSSGIAVVSAGDEHTCAATEAGGVLCWGNNLSGQLGDGTTTVRHTPVQVLAP